MKVRPDLVRSASLESVALSTTGLEEGSTLASVTGSVWHYEGGERSLRREVERGERILAEGDGRSRW